MFFISKKIFITKIENHRTKTMWRRFNYEAFHFFLRFPNKIAFHKRMQYFTWPEFLVVHVTQDKAKNCQKIIIFREFLLIFLLQKHSYQIIVCKKRAYAAYKFLKNLRPYRDKQIPKSRYLMLRLDDNPSLLVHLDHKVLCSLPGHHPG